MNNNQLRALRESAQNKSDNTRIKVDATIKKMRDEELPISIGSVASAAGISRSWLYNNPEFRMEIEKYRSNNGKIKRIVDLRSQLVTKDKIIISLKKINSKLRNDIKNLRRQLEATYGQLYRKNST